MDMNRKILAFVLVASFWLATVSVNAQETASPIIAIQNYIHELNENRWEAAASWWDEKSRQEWLRFFSNHENRKHRRGLFNIKKAHLVRWKELPYEYGKQYLPGRYMDKFQNPKVFYVGVEYEVHAPNEFFINGVNYFLIAMAFEKGKWKIVLAPHVPVQPLIEDGFGFGTDDEKAYTKRRGQFD